MPWKMKRSLKIQIIIKFERLIRFDSIQSNRTAWSNRKPIDFLFLVGFDAHIILLCMIVIIICQSMRVNCNFFRPTERRNVWKCAWEAENEESNEIRSKHRNIGLQIKRIEINEFEVKEMIAFFGSWVEKISLHHYSYRKRLFCHAANAKHCQHNAKHCRRSGNQNKLDYSY